MSRSTKPRTSPACAGKALSNRLRIIGGRWRSVPITFPPVAALRPSPDRVRETLFNWLQHSIIDARCLDLFAGSGALGLEALSRGAAEVHFVDSEAVVGRHLQQTLAHLKASGGEVHVTDAMRFLDGKPRPFDVVFLDPPFASQLLEKACGKLTAGWLADGAFVYLECPADKPLPTLPTGWSMHRSKRAGQVGYHLLRVNSSLDLR
ncbi:16S rRNA (guanine966-N2)-methyltransferase [Povalibacter uvarum]|uniref:Ribosomal RNA small subunit methyltransferase D n=1 Tax=Povalibacter uvarum TaxID=732238 RepID=A0A841HJT6_9GAMM|nr:16S rRNA (guanine(966)-N(2))-methyltransferase RsmD [Povalibacter uvarum]MBB6092560.1 16S rRNA (guanine966-N2)-methyltransferase [Povalibacter uvarum]